VSSKSESETGVAPCHAGLPAKGFYDQKEINKRESIQSVVHLEESVLFVKGSFFEGLKKHIKKTFIMLERSRRILSRGDVQRFCVLLKFLFLIEVDKIVDDTCQFWRSHEDTMKSFVGDFENFCENINTHNEKVNIYFEFVKRNHESSEGWWNSIQRSMKSFRNCIEGQGKVNETFNELDEKGKKSSRYFRKKNFIEYSGQNVHLRNQFIDKFFIS